MNLGLAGAFQAGMKYADRKGYRFAVQFDGGYAAGMDKVRFKNQVRPGDNIEVRGKITAKRGLTFFVDAEAKVDGKLCAKGSLIFMLADKN